MCNIHFILTPPLLQVKVTKYFDFVNLRVVVCVRFSSETTWPISPMMIPINWGNNVDVQHRLHFDLTPSWLQVKVTKYFDLVNLDVWWVVDCVRFSSETTWPISPMMIPINWVNNVDAQRTLILTLTTPWLQVKVTKYFNFVNLDVWRVVVCVRFSSETTWPNSLMLMPIYRGNNVDLQHILHFDLHPSMTAGQGHEILQFCEFRLLSWHEC